MNAFRFLPATVTARSLHRFGHSLFSVVLFFFLNWKKKKKEKKKKKKSEEEERKR